MPRRISDELKEKIRKLQEEVLSDSQIAKMLNLPYSTVNYQRPEVRERKRKYMREYRQKPEVRQRYWLERYQEVFPKMTADLNEFINLTPNAPYTIFAGILKLLEESKLGLKYYQIFKRLEKSEYRRKLWGRENILWELNRLREMNFVSYNDKRYALTDKGKELVKKLVKKLYEI